MVGVVTVPYPLHLEIPEEPFRHRVAPAISLAAHSDNQSMAVQQFRVFGTGVLAALLRMDDQTWQRLASPDGERQRVALQSRRHGRRHRLADYLARVQLHHSSQVQPAAALHPRHARLVLRELSIQHVRTGRPCLLLVVWTNLRLHFGRHPLAFIRVRRMNSGKCKLLLREVISRGRWPRGRSDLHSRSSLPTITCLDFSR